MRGEQARALLVGVGVLLAALYTISVVIVGNLALAYLIGRATA